MDQKKKNWYIIIGLLLFAIFSALAYLFGFIFSFDSPGTSSGIAAIILRIIFFGAFSPIMALLLVPINISFLGLIIYGKRRETQYDEPMWPSTRLEMVKLFFIFYLPMMIVIALIVTPPPRVTQKIYEYSEYEKEKITNQAIEYSQLKKDRVSTLKNFFSNHDYYRENCYFDKYVTLNINEADLRTRVYDSKLSPQQIGSYETDTSTYGDYTNILLSLSCNKKDGNGKLLRDENFYPVRTPTRYYSIHFTNQDTSQIDQIFELEKVSSRERADLQTVELYGFDEYTFFKKQQQIY